MKTNNVNGQNGVATSAAMMHENKFKGLMYIKKNYTQDLTDDVEKSMTIREYYEKHKNEYDITEEPFYSFEDDEESNYFHIEEDEDGDLLVRENTFNQYYEDDVPLGEVIEDIEEWVKNEIIKFETEIEKRIEYSEYKVLDAFEITNAQGENSFEVDYNKWWDYVLGETPDWIIDKYFDKFCDVLYGYFVKYAKDYDYGVEEIDGGISLEKPDYNN